MLETSYSIRCDHCSKQLRYSGDADTVAEFASDRAAIAFAQDRGWDVASFHPQYAYCPKCQEEVCP